MKILTDIHIAVLVDESCLSPDDDSQPDEKKLKVGFIMSNVTCKSLDKRHA